MNVDWAGTVIVDVEYDETNKISKVITRAYNNYSLYIGTEYLNRDTLIGFIEELDHDQLKYYPVSENKNGLIDSNFFESINIPILSQEEVRVETIDGIKYIKNNNNTEPIDSLTTK
ncbi:hypothetical protein [Leuconostoc mesenteroides]|uniref:hypothetical protein n=1 Tax=Leuconostoc mesenteroides TaxID=1245 RepID=UPI0030CC7F24